MSSRKRILDVPIRKLLSNVLFN